MSIVVSIVMRENLLRCIDRIRGDVSRSKFISRLLGKILKLEEGKGQVPDSKGEMVIQSE